MQKHYFDDDIKKEERKSFHNSWFNEETVDYWRHQRMYETIRPLAEFFKDGTWVSIGDGRYGLDSVRLEKLFGIHVFPTDLSEEMLKKGREIGLIHNYRVENAEKLGFEDNSFDIVFCKESFHHFPRPIIAIYEMIRVCRFAVILIEPCDYVMLPKPMILLIQMVKLMVNNLLPNNKFIKKEYKIWNSRDWHSFEESGNYVYSISVRELEKIVHGIDLGGLACKGFNDHYIKGCEFERAEPNNQMFIKIKGTIDQDDVKCAKYPIFYSNNFVTSVIFKQTINEELRKRMTKSGFKFSTKAINPYRCNS